MIVTQLESTARALVSPGRGILAADESHPHHREALRRARRREHRGEPPRLPRDAVHHAGGGRVHQRRHPVRRDDPAEGRRRHAARGSPRQARASSPASRSTRARRPWPAAAGELITEGLDGLRERLAEYRDLGARFAKWRAVITIGAGIPTPYCIDANAHALARYAALCQEAGLVPIVEPEVLMDGDHTIERCVEVTEAHAPHRLRRAPRASASRSRECCSSRTWSSPARAAPGRRASRRWPRPRSAASGAPCRRRCPASCSSPAARATSWRRRT